MYEIFYTKKFQKDLKLLKKRNLSDFRLLQEFTNFLAINGAKGLEKKHKAHKLAGHYNGFWECHVKPDLLLIWDENESLFLIELIRTGAHSDLF